MNTQIKELAKAAGLGRVVIHEIGLPEIEFPPGYEKFAELIVKKCAEAADMAYDADCKYPGDYVWEQLGYKNGDRTTE